MKHLIILSAFLLGAVCVPARADSIAITYSLTGTGTVLSSTDTTLTLEAQASAALLSGDAGLNAAWNPVTYSDQSVLDFTTSLLNGNFTLSLASGDTLTGNVFEDQSAIDAITGTGPFTQTLTFTGGTGEFADATGSVSGNGFLGTTDFTVSGSGTVDAPAAPEPSSLALIFGGLGLTIAGAARRSASILVRSAA
ncbi:MAG: PEP-CTERM sorting domain-containing protein [Bryobacteraceae bacterium]